MRDSSSASPVTVFTMMACAAEAQNVQMAPMRRLKYVLHIFARSLDSDATTARVSCVHQDVTANKIVSTDQMRGRNYVEVQRAQRRRRRLFDQYQFNRFNLEPEV